jgi:hypothetical protein
MAWKDILTILLTVLTSGAVFGFIQFLITRKDTKKDKQKEILDKLDTLSSQFAERDARIARENILRFDDELIAGMHHSREYFRVILEDDVDNYERYCSSHAEFKNSFTAEAVAHIRLVYKELLKEGVFKSA